MKTSILVLKKLEARDNETVTFTNSNSNLLDNRGLRKPLTSC